MSTLMSQPYTSDFEQARKAYRPPPNDSKSDSFKAWNQIEKCRPAQNILLACIQAYNEFIDQQNVERAKHRREPYPRTHFATWLRQRRYENEALMQRATAILENEERQKIQRHESAARLIETGSLSYCEQLTKIRREIADENKFALYFSKAIVENDTLRVGSIGLAASVARNYQFAVDRAFGRHMTIEA